MEQALCFDGLKFDPFSLFQNGFAVPEVDIGGGEVLRIPVMVISE